MERQIWHARFEIGIDDVDRGNRDLLEQLETIQVAAEGGDRTEVIAALGRFEIAARAHLSGKEKLMQDCAYVCSPLMIRAHTGFLEEIRCQIEAIINGSTTAAAAVAVIVRWFGHHVLALDAELGHALHAQQGVVDRRDWHPLTDVPYDRRIGEERHIVWTPKLKVGIDLMDDDHRHLIDLYNRLAVPETLNDRARTSTLLNELGQATVAHFQREEELMQRHAYAAAAEHRAEHARLLDELAHQIDDWRDDRMSAPSLSRFMYHWLLHHIVTYDRPAADGVRVAG